MIFHHIGVACKNIEQSISIIDKIFQIEEISNMVYDEKQKANLCMIKTKNNINIELISGDIVENLLKKGINYYHTCYMVKNIEEKIKELQNSNCVLISNPKEAILFENKKVAFLYTPFGMIELLEE